MRWRGGKEEEEREVARGEEEEEREVARGEEEEREVARGRRRRSVRWRGERRRRSVRWWGGVAPHMHVSPYSQEPGAADQLLHSVVL